METETEKKKGEDRAFGVMTPTKEEQEFLTEFAGDEDTQPGVELKIWRRLDLNVSSLNSQDLNEISGENEESQDNLEESKESMEESTPNLEAEKYKKLGHESIASMEYAYAVDYYTRYLKI